jgi:phosphatidylinositol alpha-mannosyltransferase
VKVALVLDDSIDRPDGVQQWVRALGGYLEGVGHEVHYVCSVSESDDPRVHAIARNVSVRFNGNGLQTPLPASRAKVRELLEREDFDVIHVQTPHSPVLAGRVVDEARKLRARSVRIVGTFLILPTGRLASLATRALGVALRKNLRKFDVINGVSPASVEFARESFGIEPVLIPLAIDTTAFAKAVRVARAERRAGDKLVLAFLGRLVERKGALELIEALALLDRETLDGLDVRIGGRGPLLGDAEALVAKHGLGSVVSFAGFVSEEDKPQFYADADIAVFPSTGGESFGIVLIEAMASGAGVVVAGANPGYLSVINDRPEVSVDARDTAVFAATLRRLIEDADLRAELHDEQAEHVKQFDLAVVGERVLREMYGVSR